MSHPGSDAEASFVLVDTLIAEERWADALRALGPLRRARKDDPEVWRRQAVALRGDGFPSEARVAALLWIELDPQSVEARRFADDLLGEREVAKREWSEEQRWAAEARRMALPPAVRAREEALAGGPGGPAGGLGGSGPSRSRGWVWRAAIVAVAALLAAAAIVTWSRRDELRADPRSAGSRPTRPVDRQPGSLTVPPEPAVAGSWAFVEQDGGRPVRWDPCRTIHYRVRVGQGPPGAIDLVRRALDRVTAATGLTFVYDGPTDRVPQVRDLQPTFVSPTSTERAEPVIIAWAGPDESDIWRTEPVDTAGFGGPASVQFAGGPPEYVSGMVMIRPDPRLPATFGTGATYGNVLLHELGHLAGLAHVAPTSELMAPALGPDTPDGYGPGDRRGLWLLGTAAGCL